MLQDHHKVNFVIKPGSIQLFIKLVHPSVNSYLLRAAEDDLPWGYLGHFCTY
jgi:hypothetical protein